MILMLHIHPSRDADLLSPDILYCSPALAIGDYIDGFGNRCSRAILPAGLTRFSSDTLVSNSGLHDAYSPDAVQHAVPDLPPETLVYLLGSRYCETDRLNEIAWGLFGGTPLQVAPFSGTTHTRSAREPRSRIASKVMTSASSARRTKA